MFHLVKFQGGSCHITKPTSCFYSQMSKIESWVVGGMVNKSEPVISSLFGLVLIQPGPIAYWSSLAGAMVLAFAGLVWVRNHVTAIERTSGSFWARTSADAYW
jgi:hypothetical protein